MGVSVEEFQSAGRLFYRQVRGPIGGQSGSMTAAVAVERDSAALCLLEFAPSRTERGLSELTAALGPSAEQSPHPLLDHTEAQLAEYAAGERTEFDLPLSMPGSAWQQRVWNELLKIPSGQTVSYGEIAQRLGSPGAARAVGLANGQNRISIIVPCHRVVASDGTLHGYGGGLPRKQALLEIEGARQPEPALFK